MEKVIIFSHESDIDGVGCIVLGNLAFKAIDYVLVPNIEKLEQTFRTYLEENKLINYDRIYVTDLSLYDPSLTMVASSSLKDKVLVFDHHQKSINDKMNRYPFTKVIEEDENKKRCATEMFLEHLTETSCLENTESLRLFAEMTRLEDTWEWKKQGSFGQKAHNLAILFNCIGIDEYISSMTAKLKADATSFSFTEEELSLIQKKKDEYEKHLETIMAAAEYFQDENNNRYGIVYADYEYRNELAELVRNSGNPEEIKYLIIVAMNKGENGQKSYRSIDEIFDVNAVAINHGGGGHPNAASVNITKEQKEKVAYLSKRDSLKYLAESKYNSKD